METYISAIDILNRAKNHPDITIQDRKEFDFFFRKMQLTEKGKERMNTPRLSNQQRNKIKNG